MAYRGHTNTFRTARITSATSGLAVDAPAAHPHLNCSLAARSHVNMHVSRALDPFSACPVHVAALSGGPKRWNLLEIDLSPHLDDAPDLGWTDGEGPQVPPGRDGA